MGEIPAHWEVKRIKHVATKIGSGKTPSGGAEVYLNEGIMLVRSQNVHFGGLRLDDVAFVDEATDREMANTRVLENDVLLNITGASLGRCCLARLAGRRANVNQHVCIIRPRQTQFDPSALSSALTSNALQAQIFNNENGISRDALNFVQIGNFAVCKPTLQEQQAITAFLDRETERIDGLVVKKERLIELLQEKRTALITRAVTKGLDPNVPMKDSGVEWLGEIPAHWGVKQLGQAMLSIMDFRGRTPLKLGMNWGGDIPAISAVNVRDGYLDLSRGVNYGSQKLHDHWMSQGPTRKGDVAFTTEAPLGNVALLPDDRQYILSQRVVLLRPSHEALVSEYLQYFLTSMAFRQGIESRATGSTAEGIKRRYLMSMPVCLPPIPQQRAVAAMLDFETVRIDALISKVRTAIDRLRELRTALISAAVTGKIDVREEAP
jgi:type I restriction enzyme S subunit